MRRRRRNRDFLQEYSKKKRALAGGLLRVLPAKQEPAKWTVEDRDISIVGAESSRVSGECLKKIYT